MRVDVTAININDLFFFKYFIDIMTKDIAEWITFYKTLF